MVLQGNFASVREAFCANLLGSIKALGVNVKASTPKGDWIQIACPMCTDKSGSASISAKSGWLTCHQCSNSEDLFTWTGKVLAKVKPWDVCQELARLCNVQLQGAKRRKFKKVPEIDSEVAADLHQRLFEDEDAEPIREWLRSRKAWYPEILDKLPIGYFNGLLIYFQHDINGKLSTRCRTYNPWPLPGKSKWGWNAVPNFQGRSVALWPILEHYKDVPKDQKAYLVEGENDCLAAMMRLGLFEKNVIVVTWTGGASGSIPTDAIPEFLHEREIHIVYDNDAFQGVGKADLAPDEKKTHEMAARKKNLIEGVGAPFASYRCNVILHAITLDPLTQWGGDLRDMIDAGLDSIDSLPSWPLSQCRLALQSAKRVPFNEVHRHLNEYIEFRCQVAGVSDDVTTVPKFSRIDCERGVHKYCEQCGICDVAADGVVAWENMQDKLACAMTDNNMPRNVMERVVRKPNLCKRWQLSPVDSSDGCRWSAMAREDDDKEGTRTVEIISKQNPPLSGELLVRGWLYIAANGTTPVLMCDYLEVADKVQIPIEPHRLEIIRECPTLAETPEEIDAFLDRWHLDISNNVTHIYGRRDMHVAIGLTMHSALWFDAMGARRRGWLDVCLIGATRSGKSAAARAYLKQLYGQHFTPMGNYSRPGLTIGTVSINGQSKSRPGVFPRNHGKLLVVDEAHLMVQANPQEGGLFPMLQGARDIGKVEVAKIAGSQMLPAAVRLIAISNWLNGGKTSFATPAQHLLALYGTPESLARLDFGVPVDELTEGHGPAAVEQFWTTDRQRAMVTRAWNMAPEDIIIDDEALREVKRLCEVHWKERYTEELPLYTEKEKIFSTLRIAIAIANMTFSHGETSKKCHVREVHVKWAAQWLEHTWKLLEYDVVSRGMMAKMGLRQSWQIEALLTFGVGLVDPMSVPYVLGKLFGTMQREELRAILGLTYQDYEPWLLKMVRNGGLEVARVNNVRGAMVSFRLTKGAIEVMQRVIKFAEECPELWEKRYRELGNWFSGMGGMKTEAPNDIHPLDNPLAYQVYEQRHVAERFN